MALGMGKLLCRNVRLNDTEVLCQDARCGEPCATPEFQQSGMCRESFVEQLSVAGTLLGTHPLCPHGIVIGDGVVSLGYETFWILHDATCFLSSVLGAEV